MLLGIYLGINTLIAFTYFVVPFIIYRLLIKKDPALVKTPLALLIISCLCMAGIVYFGHTISIFVSEKEVSTSELAVQLIFRILGGIPAVIMLIFMRRYLIQMIADLYFVSTTKKELDEANIRLEASLRERSLALEAISKSEKRFKILIENSNEMIGIFDEKGTRQYVSPAIKKFLGYSPDEVIGKGFEVIIAPEFREKLIKIFEETKKLPGGSFKIEEYKTLHKNGSVRYVESVLTNLLDNPAIKGIVFNTLDITERIQALEAVRDSGRRAHLFVENSNEIISILDKNKTRTYISGSVKKILGYDPEELTNKPAQQIIPLEDLVELNKVYLEADKNPGVAVISKNYRMLHKNGTLHIMEGIVTNRLNDPIINGYLVNSRDVTTFIETENALQAERNFALQIMNNMGQGLTVINSVGAIEYVNPAFANMLGYKPEEMIGRTSFELTHPDDQQILREAREKRSAGATNAYEVRLVRKDGSPIYLTITGVPRVNNGAIDGTIAVTNDITERRKVEEALRQQNELLSTLNQTALALMNRLDLIELLQTIITHASKLLNTEHAFAYLLNKSTDEMEVKVWGTTANGPIVNKLKKGQGLAGQVWLTGKPLFVADYATWEHRLSDSSYDNFHSMIGAPLISGNQVIGVIGLNYIYREGSFSEQDIEVLAHFAQIASIAIDNAMLYNSVQRRVSELATIQRLSKAINSTIQLDKFFQLAVEQIKESFNYPMVAIYMLEEGKLFIRAHTGYVAEKLVFELSEGVNGRTVRTGKPQFVQDASQDPDFIRVDESVRQGIYIPLRDKNGSILGTLAIDSTDALILTEEDLTLLTSLGDQVSIAVENARLFSELKESEKTQRQNNEVLSTLHKTTLALINRLDLSEVLETIVIQATSMVGAPNGFIALLDDNKPNLMTIQIGLGVFATPQELPAIQKGEGVSGKVWESGDPVLIENYRDWEHRIREEKFGELQATLGIPLTYGQEVIGVFGLAYDDVARKFGAGEIELLKRFAQLASIAIDNAKLYSSVQRRVSELATVQRLAKAINSTIQLEEFFEVAVTQIKEAFGYEMLSIYLLENGKLRLQAKTGYRNYFKEIALHQGINGRAARTGEPQIVHDSQKEPDFLIADELVRQGIYIPLKNKRGQILGTLSIEAKELPKLTNEDMHLLTLVADQVSIAVENARLFAELQEREENYRYVVNNVSEILCQIDNYGRWIFLNSTWEEVMGYSLQDSLGTYATAYIYKNDLRRVRHEFVRLLTKRTETVEIEFRMIARDGSSHLFEARGERLVDSNNNTTGAMAVLIDITQRRQQEEERLQLERRLLETQRLESLGLMAGGIAHDFNNLLVSILGNTELALLEINPEQMAFELIKQVELASHRAADLTRQMLAYSGRGKFFTHPLNLNDTLNEITRLLKTNLSKSIVLDTHLDPSLPLMEADSSQIHQLLMNLVINASEAIGQNVGIIKIITGTVWASRELLAQVLFGQEVAEGKYIFIEVIDTGQGMDEETRTKMFDPFFTTKFTGRGLGLSAVQGIVRGHKGALAIESEPGSGTTFRVYFPISQQPLIPMPDVQKEPNIVSKNSTILMVDDDSLLRNATTRMLNHFGFKVLEAVDGKHGLEVFLKHLPEIDCVLLDLTMPNLGGEETLREIRKIKEDIKIVLMSGYSEQEVAKRFSTTSQIEFLQKPYTSKELREKLLKAMSTV